MSGEDLGNELSQNSQQAKDVGRDAYNTASNVGNGINSFTNSDDTSNGKLNNDLQQDNGFSSDDGLDSENNQNPLNSKGEESTSDPNSSSGLDDIASSNPRRGFNNLDSSESNNNGETENDPDMVQNEPSENDEPQDENHPSGLDYDTANGEKANNSDLDAKKDIDFGNDTGQNASFDDLDGSNGSAVDETDSGNNTDDEADDTDDNEKDDSNKSEDDGDPLGATGGIGAIKKLIDDLAESTVGIVLLIIGLIILVVLLIIIIILYFTSPLTALKQTVEEWSADASEFFSELTVDDLSSLWADGIFDYEDSLYAHKIYIDKAFESAYNMAQTDINNKLSGLDLKDEQLETAWDSLEENNSGSWEDVYADSNYAILYTYINIAYANTVEDNIKATAEIDEDDFAAYVTKESTLSQLYTVEYDLSDLDNISITIHPFSKQGLLTLVGYNSADNMLDDITYEIYFDVSLQMIQACCSPQAAEDLNVYEELPESFEGETSEIQTIDDIVEITSTATASVSGWNMENCNYVYNALRAAGYTHEVTCGLMGNFATESCGFKTSASDGSKYAAYGLAQWQGGRKTGSDGLLKWCANNGYDSTTIEGQTAFMLHELPGQISNFSSELQHNDVIYWADIGCTKYERPSNYASYQAWVNAGKPYSASRYGLVTNGSRAGHYYIDLASRRANAVKINEMFGGSALNVPSTTLLGN